MPAEVDDAVKFFNRIVYRFNSMAKTQSPVSENSPFVATGKTNVDLRDRRLLVNKLTVGDARRLLLHEGAERSVFENVIDLGFIVVTAGLVANAIWNWDASLWHILLPLLAQYIAINTCIPILQMIYRLPDFRSNIGKCLGNIAGWFIIVGAIVGWRANSVGMPWTLQLQLDSAVVRDWIVHHQIHWPIATAYVGFAITLPARFRAYRDFGPPFVSVSFGCAVRILILFLFLCIGWIFLFSNPQSNKFTNDYGVWILWGLLLVADLLAWYGLLDIRRRLQRLDSQKSR